MRGNLFKGFSAKGCLLVFSKFHIGEVEVEVFNSDKTIIHYMDRGGTNGNVIVFANSLGTDCRLWDKIIHKLPASTRIITYDKRGHGLSQEPETDISLEDLATDISNLADYLSLRNVTFVGISIGGMIGQVLASIRPDIVSKLVLCDTAVKIGTKEIWDQRIDLVNEVGLAGISRSILERWFSKQYMAQNFNEMELFRRMLQNTSTSGYIKCCKAISETDLTSFTSNLRQPTLVLGGSDDISTPPKLVEETARMINLSEFRIIKNSGHLPCVDNPEVFVSLLNNFCEK